jgi:hypothetical protein
MRVVKFLVGIFLCLSIISCDRYQPRNMFVTSVEGPYTNYMCNYYVDGSYSFSSVVILKNWTYNIRHIGVVIHDTCGKFNVGDRLNVVKKTTKFWCFFLYIVYAIYKIF